jgi:hypothetical protein
MEFSTISDYDEIRGILINLIQDVWQNCQTECLKSRRELFRLIPYVSNINGIPNILKELKMIKTINNESYIQEMMSPVEALPEFDPYILSLIDLNMEKKLLFIMNNVSSKNAPRYLQWIVSNYRVSFRR